MVCIVQYVTNSIVNATRLSAVVNGSGNCGLAVYPDNDSGAVLGKITGSCPTNNVFTGTTTQFTVPGGQNARFCYCTSVSGNDYLAINGTNINTLINTFSTNVGNSTNTCTSGNPPSTTGALLTPTHPIPFIFVE